MQRLGLGLAALAILAAPGGAWAATKEPMPPAVKRLLDCRAIADRDARLGCFDQQSESLQAAVDSDEVMVADRTQINKARRSLFGLSLPNLAIFGSNDDPKAVVSEIESTIKSAQQQGGRNWLFVLEDGSRWAQTDGNNFVRDPKAGMPIRIRRAAIGSYLANVDKQLAVRVHRQN